MKYAQLSLLAMMAVSVFTSAQVTTARFYGTVTDPSGAVIPGATVTLTHQGTGRSATTTTDGAGEFLFDFLRVGSYGLLIEARGFKTYRSSGIELSASQQIRLTFALDVGAVAETVQVEGSAPLVSTVSSEQRNTFDTTTVKELPLSRRNFFNILTVGTGVVSSGDSVRLNGVGKNGSSYSVDGTEAGGNPEGRYASTYSRVNYVDIMSIEAIQEVHTIKGVIPAEYGDTVGGQVNLLTKSGTNVWHGSLFENFQSNALAARDQFLPTKPGLTFHQFGGAAGGPLQRDKIFIFGVYEGYRERRGVVVQGNVPTPKLRDEMLRAVPAYKLALDRLPLPNRPLTAPDADVGFYLEAKKQQASDNHTDVKGDIRVGRASQLSLTYSRGRPFFLAPAISPGGINDRTWENFDERGTASFVTGRANWTSETRFGYNSADQTRQDQFLKAKDPSHPNEETPFGRRIGGISVASMGWGIGRPELWLMEGPTMSIGEAFSPHAGKHLFKFGGRYMRRCCMRIKQAGPDFVYSTKQDLLANTPSLIDATFGAFPFHATLWELGVFGQDDFRVTPRLTLNLGVRYDFFSHLVAKGDGGLDSAFYNPDGLSLDGRFIPGPIRDPNNPYNNDGWVNLGPRLGFSYNPDGRSKTVIRGGFGILYSSQQPGAMWQSVGSKNIPFRSRFSNQDAANFGIRWPMFNDQFRKIVAEEAQRSGRLEVFSIFNPRLQNPYSMQYTLGIQREVAPDTMLESAFVGNRGVKFIMHRWANLPDRVTGVRPNPLLGINYYVDSSQQLSYVSWQSSFRKRYSHNLSGSVHYTWGKSLSTAGGDVGAYYQGDYADAQIQDFFNPRADRGPSVGDITHTFAAEWLYDLPRFSALGNRLAGHALGGWEVSGILRAQTGIAVTLIQASAAPNTRPDYTGGRPVNPDYRKTLQYLNKAAFTKVPVSEASKLTLHPGSVGVGAVRAPGAWGLDFALAKNFPVHERLKLQLRSDMFNLFNHTNLGCLDGNINSPRFGRLNCAGARVIQLNGRVSW